MKHTISVTDETFDAEVLKSDVPVLVDFWAPWCGPCRALAPTIEELAAARAGALKVVKFNTAENRIKANFFGIKGIPALLVFRDGKIMGREAGYMSRQELDSWIDETLAKPGEQGLTPEAHRQEADEEQAQATETIKKTGNILRVVNLALDTVQAAGGAMLVMSGGIVSACAGLFLVGDAVRDVHHKLKKDFAQASIDDVAADLEEKLSKMAEIRANPHDNTLLRPFYSVGLKALALGGAHLVGAAYLGLMGLGMEGAPRLLLGVASTMNAFKGAVSVGAGAVSAIGAKVRQIHARKILEEKQERSARIQALQPSSPSLTAPPLLEKGPAISVPFEEASAGAQGGENRPAAAASRDQENMPKPPGV